MTCFADHATSVVAPIVENQLIAKDTMRLRVCIPEMSARAVPGQFFMLRNSNGNDPLIGRALALYDCASDDSGWLDVVYVVKGKLTSSVSKLLPGQSVGIWGPLGNGFPQYDSDHLILVAGGIGQTPFLTLAREALGKQTFGDSPTRRSGYAKRVTFCYGVRSASFLAGLDQFRATGCEMRIASEDGTQPDGSLGPKERVTDVLKRLLDESNEDSIRIATCGPEPMMEAVAKIAADHSLACDVSLETPMACGIGICFTCVAKVGTPEDWDYKRTCVEGPVFDARQVLWH